ncbi:unnamed protein product [Heligmosomoides polygyrus]|uniref:Biogenesis of lysosome-related organelles complex 1 subunit 3 n=1 Tax=Heligmosomoides polygyrus TaxID=6339 RepID=A0A183GDW3_HELPZ|nr:unnamed protein product [Heligmosomoides polygyrus]
MEKDRDSETEDQKKEKRTIESVNDVRAPASRPEAKSSSRRSPQREEADNGRNLGEDLRLHNKRLTAASHGFFSALHRIEETLKKTGKDPNVIAAIDELNEKMCYTARNSLKF